MEQQKLPKTPRDEVLRVTNQLRYHAADKKAGDVMLACAESLERMLQKAAREAGGLGLKLCSAFVVGGGGEPCATPIPDCDRYCKLHEGQRCHKCSYQLRRDLPADYCPRCSTPLRIYGPSPLTEAAATLAKLRMSSGPELPNARCVTPEEGDDEGPEEAAVTATADPWICNRCSIDNPNDVASCRGCGLGRLAGVNRAAAAVALTADADQAEEHKMPADPPPFTAQHGGRIVPSPVDHAKHCKLQLCRECTSLAHRLASGFQPLPSAISAVRCEVCDLHARFVHFWPKNRGTGEPPLLALVISGPWMQGTGKDWLCIFDPGEKAPSYRIAARAAEPTSGCWTPFEVTR